MLKGKKIRQINNLSICDTGCRGYSVWTPDGICLEHDLTYYQAINVCHRTTDYLHRKPDKRNRPKSLFLLLGPSGSGKSTVEREVCEKLHLTSIASYTDRPRRCPGETSHVFLSPEEFDGLQDKIAYGKYDGHRYCTSYDALTKTDVYVVEPDGVKEIRGLFSSMRPVHVIGITTPDDLRMDFMEHRGDGASAVSSRKKDDANLIAQMPLLCDVIVPNIQLSRTVDTVSSLIQMWREADRA